MFTRIRHNYVTTVPRKSLKNGKRVHCLMAGTTSLRSSNTLSDIPLSPKTIRCLLVEMKIDSNNSHLKFESIQRKKKTQEIKDRARDSFGETKIERN